MSYEDRITRVLRYIYDHPDADLSLDSLAEVAAMSRFHWHRVFRAMTGETLAQATQRLRLHRAAFWLLRTNWPIDQVAQRCGYAGVPSFSRVFRAQYGLPPGQFREGGALPAAPGFVSQGTQIMFDISIETHPQRRLARLPHKGAYDDIGGTFEQLAALCATRDLWGQVQGLVGVYYDDPDSVPAPDLRADAALVVPPELTLQAPLQEGRIEAGKVAVLRFKGPYAECHKAYRYLYGSWLPEAGHETRDAPPYEIYLNTPRDVAPSELLTDICVPLV